MHEDADLHPKLGIVAGPADIASSGKPPATRPVLVITGDDLGLRADWDAAIFEAFRHGAITSTSVVTSGPTYGAVMPVLRAGGYDCGVHLNLIHGEPLSPCAAVPSLVDRHGKFPGSVWRFLARYVRGTVRTREIALEWERQVQRVFDDGLFPSHLNAHYHVHMLPPLFSLTLELARRYGIGWVRLIDEPPWYARTAGQGLHVGVLWLLARWNRTARADQRIGLIPCRGIAASGALGLAAWHALLDRLERGQFSSLAFEVSCHPGQTSEQTAALLSLAFVEEIGARTILRSFRELGVAQRPQ